jgi:hypothetical protein
MRLHRTPRRSLHHSTILSDLPYTKRDNREETLTQGIQCRHPQGHLRSHQTTPTLDHNLLCHLCHLCHL